MTSRVGSIVVAGLLVVLAVIAIVLILTLVDDDGGTDDSLVSLSLREGDTVGLGLRTEIQVTARDSEPITEVRLLVDGVLQTRAQPIFDPASGDFSAILLWDSPESLGEATITVIALNESGEKIESEIVVTVVDPSELAEEQRSRPPLTILSPQQNDRVALDQPLAVLVRGPGDAEITSFVLEVDGVIVDEVEATTATGGEAQGVLVWQPTRAGLATLRIRARSDLQEISATEVIIEVVSGPIRGSEDETDDEGLLQILTPDNNSEFEFSEGLVIPLSVAVEDAGILTALEFYVNAELVSTITPEPLADDLYRVEIPFEPDEPGNYVLQIVAITEDDRRLDDTIVINVGGEEDEEEALPDLAPTAVTVGDGNAILLTLANNGGASLQSEAVLVSVVRAADGILLDETTLDVTLAGGGSRNFTLPVRLTEALEITIIVDTLNAIAESNEENNAITTLFEPIARPDLVTQALELNQNGVAIVRVGNAGAADMVGTISVLLLFNGEVVEQLSFSGVLAQQGSLTLTGNVPISGAGQLSAIVDPDNLVAETNEGNNSLTIDVAR